MDELSAASPLFVATFRDWVIIFSGIAIGSFFVISAMIVIVLGLILRSLLLKASALMDQNVKPLLDSAKDTADHARGTASYISQAAVTPVVRTYGVIAGVRRAVGVISGLTGADSDKPGR